MPLAARGEARRVNRKATRAGLAVGRRQLPRAALKKPVADEDEDEGGDEDWDRDGDGDEDEDEDTDDDEGEE